MGGLHGEPGAPLRKSTALLGGHRGALLLALAVLATAAVIPGIVAGHRFLDLEVYRLAGRAWLSGIDLYGTRLPRPPRLPFTYPPAAAVFFSPLALLPLTLAAYAAVIATILGAGVVLRVALRATSRAAVP